MPNWCENDLRVSGKKEDLKKFIKFMKGENGNLDFNSFVPYPAKYRKMDEEYNKIQMMNEIKREMFFSLHPKKRDMKDGYNAGGYEWCCNNWGTKWNAANVDMQKFSALSETVVLINFDTAWSPPVQIVLSMSKKFPMLHFSLEYFEGGAAYKGALDCEKGEILTEWTKEYKGKRGG